MVQVGLSGRSGTSGGPGPWVRVKGLSRQPDCHAGGRPNPVPGPAVVSSLCHVGIWTPCGHCSSGQSAGTVLLARTGDRRDDPPASRSPGSPGKGGSRPGWTRATALPGPRAERGRAVSCPRHPRASSQSRRRRRGAGPLALAGRVAGRVAGGVAGGVGSARCAKSSSIPTSRATARFQTRSRLGEKAPVSTRLMLLRSTPHRSASASWLSPAASRLSRTASPNRVRRSRTTAGFGRPAAGVGVGRSRATSAGLRSEDRKSVPVVVLSPIRPPSASAAGRDARPVGTTLAPDRAGRLPL